MIVFFIAVVVIVGNLHGRNNVRRWMSIHRKRRGRRRRHSTSLTLLFLLLLSPERHVYVCTKEEECVSPIGKWKVAYPHHLHLGSKRGRKARSFFLCRNTVDHLRWRRIRDTTESCKNKLGIPCTYLLPYFSYFKQRLMFLMKTDYTYMLPLFRSLFDLDYFSGL